MFFKRHLELMFHSVACKAHAQGNMPVILHPAKAAQILRETGGKFAQDFCAIILATQTLTHVGVKHVLECILFQISQIKILLALKLVSVPMQINWAKILNHIKISNLSFLKNKSYISKLIFLFAIRSFLKNGLSCIEVFLALLKDIFTFSAFSTGSLLHYKVFSY